MGGVSGRRRTGVHATGQKAGRPLKCAVVTVSDTRRGEEDGSGATIVRLCEGARHTVAVRSWVKDEPRDIRRIIAAALERKDIDVVLVTGGTGLSPRDCTVEALEPLVERWIPGFGEVFRVLSLQQVGAAAWLSSATAAVCDGRLVFLLPGSSRAVELALRRLILPELVHALGTLGRLRQE
jgi:molybdenum cofactor biosynthesis protein B